MQRHATKPEHEQHEPGRGRGVAIASAAPLDTDAGSRAAICTSFHVSPKSQKPPKYQRKRRKSDMNTQHKNAPKRGRPRGGGSNPLKASQRHRRACISLPVRVWDFSAVGISGSDQIGRDRIIAATVAVIRGRRRLKTHTAMSVTMSSTSLLIRASVRPSMSIPIHMSPHPEPRR